MREMMTETHGRSGENTAASIAGFVSQFYVFSGESYLGWDCFDSPSVKVGGSAFADLVLDDPDIDDIQAEFFIANGRIRVVNLGREGLLTVNNRAVSESPVGSFDVVKIGRYTVKVKLKKMMGTAPEPRSEMPEFKIESVSRSPKAKETEKPIENLKKSDDLDKLDKTEDKPHIVKNLLTIMDQYDDLDFDDIQEILTTKSNEKELQDSSGTREVILTIESSTNSKQRPAPFDIVNEAGKKKEPETDGISGPEKSEKPAKDISEITLKTKIKTKNDGKEPTEIHTLTEETQNENKDKSAVKSVIEPFETAGTDVDEPVKIERTPSENTKDTHDKGAVRSYAVKNTFPANFFNVDEEDDEEEEDLPARFCLREKITGIEENAERNAGGENVLEIIKFRGGHAVSIAHVKNESEHMMVDGTETYCCVHHSESTGTRMFFTEKLLGTINKIGERELKAERGGKGKNIGMRGSVYSTLLPVKGELVVSDGFYDYVIKKSVLPPEPAEDDAEPILPLHQRALKSTAFKYSTWALMFHVILLVVCSYTIRLPEKSEFKDPETFFVKVESEDIRKPVKPIPKPIPVLPKPVQDPSNIMKKEMASKVEPKETVKQAREETSPRVAVNRTEPADTGSGKDGNVTNKNVNNVGLLAALGKKTGISLSPNEALASVTNMDAVTSTRSREANVKLGGIVGSLRDSKIAVPAGGVINNKGGAGVYRSAGIGGKGSVAAIDSGKTGKRAVKAVVAAPVAKKVRSSGGGISREAVAKVINDHMDEVNSCYESALVSDSNLMGRIEFEWTILSTGDVGDVKIKSSTVKSSQLHACIIAAIKSWKFPKPQGSDVVVSYPFVFDITGF
jgi:hypothetical protein